MLLILIPIAWLAVVVFVLAACTMASRADTKMLAASAETAAVMADNSAQQAMADYGRGHRRRRPGPAAQAPARGRRQVEPRRRTAGEDAGARANRGSRAGVGAR